MSASILELRRFTSRGAAAQSAVDRAIARADLVRLVHERKAALTAIRLKRDDDVTDALMRLGMAAAALADFDRFAEFADAEKRHEGRAPA